MTEKRRLYLQKFHKEHYLKHKEEYLLRAKKSWRKTRDAINQIKDKPCADCGLLYPSYIMSFDHLPGKEKISEVSKLVRTKGRKAALEEAEKCDVVCANCHAVRTYQRKMLASHSGSALVL